MSHSIWMDNLIAYSLQIAILAAAGTLLAYIFRLRLPRISLAYWQILLLACLLLPALQTWNHPSIYQGGTPGMETYTVSTISTATVAAKQKPSFSITPELIALILGAGICLRFLWLTIGFLRLRMFLRNSRPLSDPSPAADSLLSRIGVRARLFLSLEIDSPATVGVFSPVILLPGSFPGMSEACREAVICHELLHVRRRDWAVILVEEIVRSIFWFHPAVWWLLGRIHLAREQSVDYEVVQLTGSRQPYLNSLLEIARLRGRPRAVPAPLFLRERHLVQRVALLIKEVSMNRLRLTVSLLGSVLLLACTVRFAAGWLPLTGEPRVVRQEPLKIENTQHSQNAVKTVVPVAKAAITSNALPSAAPARKPVMTATPIAEPAPVASAPVAPPQSEPIRVGADVQESKLIRRVDPVYPELAKRARVQGKVVLMITVNAEGYVTDVQVISGHPLLSETAVAAVRQWRYSPTLLNGQAVPVIATVTVIFNLQGGPPASDDFGGESNMFRPDGLGGYIGFRATPINEKSVPSPLEEGYRAPELALSTELLQQWHRMAEAGWPANLPKNTYIAYRFIVGETGEVQNFARIQGPEIPELEASAAQIRVAAPGIRASAPIRSSCILEIRLEMPASSTKP
jgi:TonB family protein